MIVETIGVYGKSVYAWRGVAENSWVKPGDYLHGAVAAETPISIWLTFGRGPVSMSQEGVEFGEDDPANAEGCF